jgi:anaerobic magnesium-protoporphyrin IX monomethyl ester cyclase
LEIPEKLYNRSQTLTLRAIIAIPSVYDFYFTPHRFSSLGAKILGGLLADNAIDASIINFPVSQKRGLPIPLPHELSYIHDFFSPQETGKLSYFTKYRQFGPSPEQCANTIVSASPDLCFISCFAFSYAMQTLDLARHIKKLQPKLPIIVGGAGPSSYPQYFIRDPSIDFVLTHESEISTKSFLAALLDHTDNFSSVPNCFWKKNSAIQIPSVNQFTRPCDISVVISKTFETRDSVYFSTSLSRGCPKKCGFCSNSLTHGASFRVASIDTVKQALSHAPIEAAHRTKKIFIIFEDDNLLIDETYCFEIIRLFKSTFKQAAFLFENGIDYTLLSPELVDRLAMEGVSQFNLSIATTDSKIARQERRPLSIDHYEKVVRSVASHRVPCITYFICGFKDDTKQSIAATLAFLHSQPTLIGISLFYAVPGISGFQDLSRFDDLPPFLCNGSSAYPWNGSLSTETLITAFRLSRYCNLVKQEKKSDFEIAALRKIQETKRLFTFVKTPQGIEIAAVQHYDEELTEMFFEEVAAGVKMDSL